MKLPPQQFQIDVRYAPGGEWVEFAVRQRDEAHDALRKLRERGVEARLIALDSAEAQPA